ncbi:hypothetical protein A3K73_01830 [Candidatus Pacearchaeota archaeon RBG_13_36_9]|nr:MAG: hypothetical protein A3K73_01830 [Candidatus Pacearchaeota archaeon RBG_13_36_9]
MYEKIAENFLKNNGCLLLNHRVVKINHQNNKIKSIVISNKSKQKTISSDSYISSMPITELVQRLSPQPPKEIIQASKNLHYRSFVTASLVLSSSEPFPDTWIYVHSPEVKIGRVQNFKKWSHFMVSDPDKIALGVEYFCTEGDELWSMTDKDLIELALTELEKIKLIKKSDYLDGFVVRAEKAYPVYDSSYPKNIKLVKEYLANFKNLISIGRGGLFKYNNMDHSILTGLYAAENLLGASHNLEEVNADQEYQEEKTENGD